MGTIIERARKDGSTAYMAQIMIMRDRKVVHRESKTFDRRPAATAWIRKREAELAKPDAALGVKQGGRNPTLAQAIDRYITESRRALGRTKAQVLAAIKSHDIAGMACADIRSDHIVEFANALAARVQPSTVANYMSHLGAVFAIARPAWGYPLEERAMSDAFRVTRRLGVTGKPMSRERRPTLDELDRLLAHFAERRLRRPGVTPMVAIIVFALFSTRRLEEITRIRWSDLDAEGARVMVRDMKNPGEKLGNDVWCDLPEPALRLASAMPRQSIEIFPYGGDGIGAAFTRACRLLAIEDLHFHDLRHEGVSRLFEMGRTIPQVASVSGHRSWQSLKRYTHLRQTGDRFERWRWIDLAVAEASETKKAPPQRGGRNGALTSDL
jgi:integrase